MVEGTRRTVPSGDFALGTSRDGRGAGCSAEVSGDDCLSEYERYEKKIGEDEKSKGEEEKEEEVIPTGVRATRRYACRTGAPCVRKGVVPAPRVSAPLNKRSLL
jgi:hypothetical protein